MTFYEAAIEVLRRTGRPLHFKKITEFAIRDALLSHVGKAPDATMKARLEQELKREADSWLVGRSPGVYSLREDILDQLNAEAAERDAELAANSEVEEDSEAEVDAAPVEDTAVDGDADADVDVEGEETDDGDEEDGEAPAQAGGQEGGRNGRRRRRRRGRRGNREERQAEAAAAVVEEEMAEEAAAAAPAAHAAPAVPAPVAPAPAAPEERQPRRTRGERPANGVDTSDQAQALAQEALEDVREERREHREQRGGRHERVEAEERGERRERGDRQNRGDRQDRGERREARQDRGEPREAREDRGERREAREDRSDRREAREERGERKEDRGDRRERREEARPDVSGRFDSVGEAAFAVLKASNRQAMTAKAIAETVFQRKLVKFHTHDAAATVQAAMVADNQLRHGQGRRQVFANYGNGNWGLTEWGLTDAGVQKERQIQKLVQELRDDASVQLANSLAGLKTEAFEMVILAVLERLNYRNVRVSKRTSDGDAFFTADWRNGFTEARVCIQVVGDAEAEVDAEDVQLLRDTLQHYAGTEGVLIHMGDVAKDAYREIKTANGARISILDRETLVKLMVQEGIGVRHHQVSVAMVDTAFIESLKV